MFLESWRAHRRPIELRDECRRVLPSLAREEVELGRRGELLEFLALSPVPAGTAHFAFRRQLGVLQVGENLLRAGEHFFGNARQPGHLQTIAFVGAPRQNFAQENDLIVPLADCHVEIPQAGEPGGQFGQLMVMGGEEGFGANLVMEEFDQGPCEAQAIESAGAAADLVEDDEAAPGRVVEDVGRLAHLDHEGGLAAGEIIAGADAAEDAVHEVNAGGGGGKK